MSRGWEERKSLLFVCGFNFLIFFVPDPERGLVVSRLLKRIHRWTTRGDCRGGTCSMGGLLCLWSQRVLVGEVKIKARRCRLAPQPRLGPPPLPSVMLVTCVNESVCVCACGMGGWLEISRGCGQVIHRCHTLHISGVPSPGGGQVMCDHDPPLGSSDQLFSRLLCASAEEAQSGMRRRSETCWLC